MALQLVPVKPFAGIAHRICEEVEKLSKLSLPAHSVAHELPSRRPVRLPAQCEPFLIGFHLMDDHHHHPHRRRRLRDGGNQFILSTNLRLMKQVEACAHINYAH